MLKFIIVCTVSICISNILLQNSTGAYVCLGLSLIAGAILDTHGGNDDTE